MSNASDWFRSAEMDYISIVMQESLAYKCLARLGRLGAVQFTDLNPEQTAVQRRYIHEVQRCDIIERKLAFFGDMLEKYDIQNKYAYDRATFLDKIEQKSGEGSILNELETLVEEKEKEVKELNGFRASLMDDYNYQLERKEVLEKSREVLENDSSRNAHQGNISKESSAERKMDGLSFSFLSGTILLNDKLRFERMVFRATRGNCFMRFSNIDSSETGSAEENAKKLKTVFIIFYQSEAIEDKIQKICDAFSATLFEIPELDDLAGYNNEFEKVRNEIEDRNKVLDRNKMDIEASLEDLTKWLEIWKWSVAREKSIFHTLNHFSADVKGVLRAEGWVISNQKQKVQDLIQEVHAKSSTAGTLPSSVSTMSDKDRPKMPPTYFKTNKFTNVFQVLVDTYGVPRYREANPSLPNVITFPFLFGVMFGDIGHGIILLLFSLYIVYKEEEFGKMKLDEITIVIYSGRYFMVLMGFFALYCGIIYNDYFAMGLNFFEVTFMINDTEFTAGEDTVLFVPKQGSDVYPLGIDPTWHHSDNGLLFFNSVKMKMAVIFGVVQMTMGLFLKLANAIHFRSKVDIFFEAIPQIIFLVGLFGYMCLLVVLKWSLSWRPFCERELNCEPPSIITTMIDMFLNIGNIDDNSLIYENQAQVQTILILLVVISIPWMLIPKPVILSRELKKHKEKVAEMKKGHAASKSNGNGRLTEHESERLLTDEGLELHREGAALSQPIPGGEVVEHEEEETTTDLWIHQGIETIEFCLGGMSNTASYLRLWALSLAHSQLGLVFLENTMLNYITTEGAFGVIMAFAGYGAFAGISFAVLMVMDNLECFLHALRLHWVEFQSKFYKADGVAFTPLDFKQVLSAVDNKEA